MRALSWCGLRAEEPGCWPCAGASKATDAKMPSPSPSTPLSLRCVCACRVRPPLALSRPDAEVLLLRLRPVLEPRAGFAIPRLRAFAAGQEPAARARARGGEEPGGCWPCPARSPVVVWRRALCCVVQMGLGRLVRIMALALLARDIGMLHCRQYKRERCVVQIYCGECGHGPVS
jgi:hypothetical protein